MTIDQSLFEQLSIDVLGLKPPKPEEIARARELLADAPRSGPPIDVAFYFAKLTAKNVDGHAYNAEWPDRANPIIVSFFEATNYGSPEGDQTKWCAAFMNWCLQRVSRASTRSASSGSFRCFGAAADDSPQVGDIAVFKNSGQDVPCRGSGHVGFFVERKGNYVEVLGGNQGNSIRISSYPTDEVSSRGSPWLVSIRKVPSGL